MSGSTLAIDTLNAAEDARDTWFALRWVCLELRHERGARNLEIARDISRRYVRELYNRFAATIVPSPALAQLLGSWGVQNTRLGELGVDTLLFHAQPPPDERRQVREALDDMELFTRSSARS